MADTSTPNFVTQAVNFLSTVTGGVDPRTGLYNITLSFGTVTGNRGLGPALPLALSYSPLNTQNIGFGVGVSLGHSVYTRDIDGNPRMLSLSTGETYGVDGDDAILQQRLRNMLFVPEKDPELSSHQQFRVVHKSGDVEALKTQQDQGYYVPRYLFTPAGHKLTCEWHFRNGSPYLDSVTDDTGAKLLDISRDYVGQDLDSVALNVLPGLGGGESYTVELDYRDNLLSEIQLKAAGIDTLRWTFRSFGTRYWGTWLDAMKGPGGYSETATYDDQTGMAFPGSASYDPMPCVSLFERDPGSSGTSIRASYDYTANNYLGNGSSIGWDDSIDPMLGEPFNDTYLYGSTETRKASNGDVKTITRTYNAYHLPVREVIEYDSSGRNKKTTVTNYALSNNRPIAQQNRWYQLPSSKTVSWQSDGIAATPETTQYSWDDFGNPLTRIDPDGAVTTWEYYDENGESENGETTCPKAPYGLKRFAKSMLVDASKVATPYSDTPLQKTAYRYASAPPVAGSLVEGLVMKNHESITSNGKLLSETSYSYDNSAGKDAGRLRERTTIHYANDGSNNSYATHETFDYQDDTSRYPNGLKKSQNLTAHDQLADALTITSSQVSSMFTGRVWQKVDAQGNVTHYDFDGLGRRTKRVYDPGTPYENSLTYDYIIADANADDSDSHNPFITIKTDSKGNKIRYILDGMRRLIQQDINCVDKDGKHDNGSTPWYTQLAQRYDDQGRLISSTATDQLPDGSATYSLTATFTYDGWWQPSQRSYNDGTVETTLHDPVGDRGTDGLHHPKTSVTRNSTTNTVQIGTQVTTYDYHFSKKPIKVEQYKKNGSLYSARSMQYDGLHRLRSETDELKHTTTYDYDEWNRLSKTSLPDGTIVTYRYSPDSPDKRVTDITVQNANDPNLRTPVSVGTQGFDALGRVIAKTVGGRPWTYHYANAADTKPSTVNAPEGVDRQYSYIKQLGEKLATVNAGAIDQHFSYDDSTGALTQATTSNAAQQYNRAASGRLSGDGFQWDSQNQQTTYAYTVKGDLYRYTHIDGAVQTTQRDSYGRLQKVADPTASVTPAYDAAGRLSGWTAADTKGHQLTVTLALDDFGRETQRTIVDNKNGVKWVITQQWNEGNLLTSRITQRNASIDQQVYYSYNERNQLIEADYSNNYPTDRFGNKLAQQNFTLDGLGNITQVITKFGDSPTNNNTTFTYDYAKDPCQLVSVQNTRSDFPSFQLTYDGAGRLLTDDKGGHSFSYDELGRVKHAASQLTGLSGDYHYEAHNRLYSQTRSDQADPIYFYYRANQLINLAQGNIGQRLFRSQIGFTAQNNTGDKAGVWLVGTNNQGSVLSGSDGVDLEERKYSAYGEEKLNG